ncbi:SusC/RagA family TonB-linked outer membrane protein [Flavobacterium sp. LS1R47]|uniref:SusC/RagA family TonB-linked outer membrane protein n=1 Tax=Flavobacterium frigoritolerans TaxID=2987686 RepID=A0A9X2ZKQ5_9FLAO|nr:SusC/RagA family TonB-linked outer membrane protein [Flavobacterium frigoritolerans]MCV9932874.1 SusC/RagA family TonB-linked outer membrane protein [Flavobacterium frigoritolerans]
MNNFSFYKGSKALYYLIFFGCFLSFTPVLAKSALRQLQSNPQQNVVSGIITDGTNPLPGVTIAIKSKANSGTISDYNGQYGIIANELDTLVVSFIGFKTALIPIKGRQTISIVLEYDTMVLQEVRVNAGYYTVKESERTGSISRITSKDIETQPVTNVLATLQGRMAGVSVTQTTGVPGGGFDIKIRGQNSIRSDTNAPLYIIDGVPYASDAIGASRTATTFPTPTSPLNSINPDMIESIEILKDADATAIYGSRGANGVVLITTKKGKAGKTTFTVTASTGAGNVPRFLKLMDTGQYLAMRKQAFINDGLSQYGPLDYDINGTWDQNRYTDWQKELLGGTAQLTDFQGTISGGSETTQFLVSASYHTETTVFPGEFLYKKGGSQINLNHRSEDKKFRITFSVGYTSQNNQLPSYDPSYEARSLPPNAPALYDANGNLNWENSTWINPLGKLGSKFETKTNDLIANSVLSYELLPGLLLKSSLGYTDLSTHETRIIPSTTGDPALGNDSSISALFLNNTDRSSWIVEPQINWKKELGLGKMEILFGATFQNQITKRIEQSGSGFSSNSLIYNLAAAKTIRVVRDEEIQYKYQAFFGRLNYNWQQRYIVNLTARHDGSSRFGPGNQFANFGAIGLAWLFSNENFLKSNSWFSFGKLRGSYGTTGSDQIGDYQFLNTYTTSGVVYNGVIGLKPSRLYNANFGWETNKKLEMALELGFLKDRIFTTVAWYQNQSSNQLAGVPLPGTTGFTLLQSNLDATVQNTGIELSVGTTNFKSDAFNWTTSINLTFAKNKLLRFPGLESSPYSQQYRIGEPLNIVLLYKYKGVNPQTGIYEFEDVNNDSRISAPEDKQTLVDLNPQYYGGIQNQLSYKRWTLDFLFQFVKQKSHNYPMDPAGMMSNEQERKINSWQQPGDSGTYQIYTTGYNSDAITGESFYAQSDADIADASFIRLKNIALSYDVPLNLKQSQCKIMLQGQNLLTFTRYKDGDPEYTSGSFLAPLKVISAGVQLTF